MHGIATALPPAVTPCPMPHLWRARHKGAGLWAAVGVLPSRVGCRYPCVAEESVSHPTPSLTCHRRRDGRPIVRRLAGIYIYKSCTPTIFSIVSIPVHLVPGTDPARSLGPNLAHQSQAVGLGVCTSMKCFGWACMDFFFFFRILLLSSFWTSRGHRCRSFSSPVLAFNFLSRIGFSNPTARRFSLSVANSRSRVFRKSICAQEEVPTNLHEYALGGARTHETDPYQARG